MFFQTQDLIVDPLTLQDSNRFHAICNQDFVLRWMPDWAHSRANTERFIEFFIQGYTVLQPDQHPLAMAVRLAGSTELIGLCGFGSKDELGGDVEICYFIDEAYSNRGYMRQVVKSAIDYYFKAFDRPHLCALVDRENTPSYKLLMQNGFEFTPASGNVQAHYRLVRPQ